MRKLRTGIIIGIAVAAVIVGIMRWPGQREIGSPSAPSCGFVRVAEDQRSIALGDRTLPFTVITTVPRLGQFPARILTAVASSDCQWVAWNVTRVGIGPVERVDLHLARVDGSTEQVLGDFNDTYMVFRSFAYPSLKYVFEGMDYTPAPGLAMEQRIVGTWNVATGVRSEQQRVLAWTADGQLIVRAPESSGGEIEVVDVATGHIVTTLQALTFTDVAFAPDGTKLALATFDDREASGPYTGASRVLVRAKDTGRTLELAKRADSPYLRVHWEGATAIVASRLDPQTGATIDERLDAAPAP